MAAGWVRRTWLWIERALLVAGAVSLASVFVLWQQAAFYQVRAKREMAEVLADTRAPRASPAARPGCQADARDLLSVHYVGLAPMRFIVHAERMSSAED